MPTKLITKNSSTASAVPTAGQLDQGELAVNVTDKRLFTKDSGGTVRELGTNPTSVTTPTINNSTGVSLQYNGSTKAATTSTGIDVTGTVVADGLTVDGDAVVTGGSDLSNTGATLQLESTESLAAGIGAGIAFKADDGSGTQRTFGLIKGAKSNATSSDFNGGLEFYTRVTAQANVTKRMDVLTNGDISFYEDTGNTAKFFWDASAESLGIGTTTPSALLHVKESSTGVADTVAEFGNAAVANGLQLITSDGNLEWGFNALNSRSLVFQTNQTERMRIDSSGRVGIGTSSPSDRLTISGGANQIGIDTGDIATYGTLDIGHFTNGTFIGTQAGSNAASNILRLGTGGTERMRIDSAGNVGIGTTSPAVKLDVVGQVRASTGILFGTDTAAANALDDYEEGTWTPTLTGLTLGDGSIDASYTKIGDVVTYHIIITYGTTSTITGNVTASMPTTPAKGHTLTSVAVDSGTNVHPLTAHAVGTNATIGVINSAGTYAVRTGFSSTIPFTWASGDLFYISGVYKSS